MVLKLFVRYNNYTPLLAFTGRVGVVVVVVVVLLGAPETSCWGCAVLWSVADQIVIS